MTQGRHVTMYGRPPMSTEPPTSSTFAWTMRDDPNPALTVSFPLHSESDRIVAITRFAEWLERAAGLWPGSRVQIHADMQRERDGATPEGMLREGVEIDVNVGRRRPDPAKKK